MTAVYDPDISVAPRRALSPYQAEFNRRMYARRLRRLRAALLSSTYLFRIR